MKLRTRYRVPSYTTRLWYTRYLVPGIKYTCTYYTSTQFPEKIQVRGETSIVATPVLYAVTRYWYWYKT